MNSPLPLDVMEANLAELRALLRRPDTELSSVFQLATEIVVRCLQVEGASVWSMENRNPPLIRCEDAFSSSDRSHTSGELLDLDAFPAYAAASRTERIIDASDACVDPRTRRLIGREGSLPGVSSILSSSLFIAERHVGRLFAEHVGPARTWSPAERLFLSALGDLLTVAMASSAGRLARARERINDAFYRGLVEDQYDFIVRLMPSGRALFANRALAEFLGLPLSGLRGRSIFDFLEPEDHPIIHAANARISPEHPTTQYQHRVLTSSGDVGMVEWRLRGFFDSTGHLELYQAVGRDITAELIQAEQVREGHRLEAMALIAGGVVHDLNNILSPIAAYADLALQTLPPDRPEVENMRKILAATQRGHDLARQVALFSRREHTGVRMPVSIGPFILESLSFLQGSVPSQVVLRSEVDDDLVMVANPSDVFQMLSNLVGNAISSMSDGGEVMVRAERKAPDRLVIQVIDDGPGIDVELQSSIFKPFFTTRKESGGTGMGLAVVQNLVAALGGTIKVQSAVGRGTTFTLEFPALSPVPIAEPNGLATEGLTSVLVVDDDPDIVEFLVMALDQLGYSVDSTSSPKEALRKVKKRTFDLLLTDLTMPVMDGLTLAAEVKKRRPDQSVLLISGYCDLLTDEELSSKGIGGMLAKPFTLRQLSAAMRRVLD